MDARDIGYVRVSTDEQGQEGVSLEAQAAALQAWATRESRDLEIRVEIQSAKNTNRPVLQSILREVQEGRVRTLVVFKLHRLFRSTEDALRVERTMLAPHGCKLVSLAEVIDTETASGLFTYTINAALAEYTRRVIGENTRNALALLRTQGVRLGAVPFDQRRVSRTEWVPNPEGQAVVAQVLDLRAAGHSYKSIARYMMAHAIPAPRGGRSWNHTTVRRIVIRYEEVAA